MNKKLTKQQKFIRKNCIYSDTEVVERIATIEKYRAAMGIYRRTTVSQERGIAVIIAQYPDAEEHHFSIFFRIMPGDTHYSELKKYIEGEGPIWLELSTHKGIEDRGIQYGYSLNSAVDMSPDGTWIVVSATNQTVGNSGLILLRLDYQAMVDSFISGKRGIQGSSLLLTPESLAKYQDSYPLIGRIAREQPHEMWLGTAFAIAKHPFSEDGVQKSSHLLAVSSCVGKTRYVTLFNLKNMGIREIETRSGVYAFEANDSDIYGQDVAIHPAGHTVAVSYCDPENPDRCGVELTTYGTSVTRCFFGSPGDAKDFGIGIGYDAEGYLIVNSRDKVYRYLQVGNRILYRDQSEPDHT